MEVSEIIIIIIPVTKLTCRNLQERLYPNNKFIEVELNKENPSDTIFKIKQQKPEGEYLNSVNFFINTQNKLMDSKDEYIKNLSSYNVNSISRMLEMENGRALIENLNEENRDEFSDQLKECKTTKVDLLELKKLNLSTISKYDFIVGKIKEK